MEVESLDGKPVSLLGTEKELTQAHNFSFQVTNVLSTLRFEGFGVRDLTLDFQNNCVKIRMTDYRRKDLKALDESSDPT